MREEEDGEDEADEQEEDVDDNDDEDDDDDEAAGFAGAELLTAKCNDGQDATLRNDFRVSLLFVF